MSLSALLTTIGLPVLMRIVSDVLTTIDNPHAQTASDALGKVTEAWQNGQISAEQRAEANRHTEKMAQIELEKNDTALKEVNKTLRQEIDSNDKYVRRMRPTFGYMMAVTFAAQMLAIAYVIVFDTAKSTFVINAMASLTAIWGVGLSVLGIYVYKRSEDKKFLGDTQVRGIIPREIIQWEPTPPKPETNPDFNE